MSRASRYLPEGKMSSINYHQGHLDRVAEKVRIMPAAKERLRPLRPQPLPFPKKA